MKKKFLYVLVIILMMALAVTMLVACDNETPPTPPPPTPPDPPKELTREDCDLIFGADGIAINGVLAPVDSDPSVGGPVSAVVKIKAIGANLRFTAVMTGITITLKSGIVERLTTEEEMSPVLSMSCDKAGQDFAKDSEVATTFVFTMPATDDMKYVGASFQIAVKLTVTHANGAEV